MQIVRTILWVLLFAALMFFSFFNWKEVEVQIWTNMVLETKVPALVVVSFLLGMIPTWLLHRGTKWRLTRRIKTLEAAARIPQVAPIQPAPGETSDVAAPLTSEDTGSSSSYTPKNPI